MGETYLADTNVVSKYFEEKLPEWALVLLDEAMNRQLIYLSVITQSIQTADRKKGTTNSGLY